MRTKAGEKVILVRVETSAEDIGGMNASEGILTARGGMTSHAAVVARGMGKSCVTGCSALAIDYDERSMRVGERLIKEGDVVTIDGGTGEVMLGEVATVTPEVDDSFDRLMGWADRVRKIRVRTNADTPADARLAREFGAEGIGLCRTEHMFFEPDRILLVREMILQLKLGRIRTGYFISKFGVEITEKFSQAFQRLVDEGMLTFDAEEVRLTVRGLLRVDQLLPEFYSEVYRNSRYT